MTLRLSIAPSYNSNKTGPRFTISSYLGGEAICLRQPIADPFVTHRVIIHWWDAIKCLLRHGRIEVEMNVGGDHDIVEDVLELDENYNGHGNTRRAEYEKAVENALAKI